MGDTREKRGRLGRKGGGTSMKGDQCHNSEGCLFFNRGCLFSEGCLFFNRGCLF